MENTGQGNTKALNEANNTEESSTINIEQSTKVKNITVKSSQKKNKNNEKLEVIAADYGLVNRTPKYQIKVFNELASSLKESAFMPELNFVFNPVVNNLGGYGIYPEGNAGMKLFNYDRNKMKGTITFRYVFRTKLDDNKVLEAVAVYPVKFNLSSFKPKKDDNVVISDFDKTEITKVVERFNRALCNDDLAALMSGEVVRDIGVGLRYGHLWNYVRLLSNSIDFKDVVARKGNYYLIKFNRSVEEAPRNCGWFGAYIEEGYMVIQHIGDRFTINDILFTKRNMTKEPEVRLDLSDRNNLIGSDLTKEVSDEHKKEIIYTLSNFYNACNRRDDVGMEKAFNNNVQVLPEIKRNYLKVKLQLMLIKYGSKVPFEYNGKVARWLGEAGNRVELIADEAIKYKGKGLAMKLQTYYLMSNVDGDWYIDDVKYIKSDTITE